MNPNSPLERRKTSEDQKPVMKKHSNRQQRPDLRGPNSIYSPIISRIKLYPPMAPNVVDHNESDAILSLLPEPLQNDPLFNFSSSDLNKKLQQSSKTRDELLLNLAKKPPLAPIQRPQKEKKIFPPMSAILHESNSQLDAKLSFLQPPDEYKNLVPPLPYVIQTTSHSDAVLSVLPEPIQQKHKLRPKQNSQLHEQRQAINQHLFGINLNELCFLQSSFNKAAGIDEKIDRNEFSLFYAQLHPKAVENPMFTKMADSLFIQIDQNQTGYFSFTQFLEAYSKLRKQMNHKVQN